jgi:excisionase family DNA binding protein
MCNALCMTQPPLMGSAEVCNVLGVDRSTLTRWIASGRIKPVQKLPGKSGAFIFTPAEVQRVRQELWSSVDGAEREPAAESP